MSAPGVPSNCDIQLFEETFSVRLSWTAPFSEQPLTNYRITISHESTILNSFSVPADTTEYTIAGLACNIEYNTVIAASNDNGNTYGPEGIFSPFILYPQPPSAPTGGGYMYESETKVNLAWGEPSNNGGLPITNYFLTFTLTSGPVTTLNTVSPIQYYTIDNLQHGINIDVTVKASNDNGATYGPELVIPTIVPITPPVYSPQSPQAVGVAPGIIDVSWTAPEELPEGSSYYMIMSVSSNSSDPFVGCGTKDSTQTSCRLTELNPQSEYYFTVKIQNQVGNSPEVVTNTVPPTHDLPPLPEPVLEEPIPEEPLPEEPIPEEPAPEEPAQ